MLMIDNCLSKYINIYSCWFLILIRVTGGELFARVADCERLSEEEASNFVQQILLGVQHMHGLGIVHLDLKVILHNFSLSFMLFIFISSNILSDEILIFSLRI